MPTTDAFRAEWDAFRRQAWERSNLHRYELVGPVAAAYLGLGLVGEIGEYVDETRRVHTSDPTSTAIDELGDVCWYIAMLEAVFLTEFSIDWTNTDYHLSAPLSATQVMVLYSSAAAVAEQLKRPLLQRDMDHRKLHQKLSYVARLVARLSVMHGGMSAVLSRNIKKNHERYGATGHQGDKT